MQGVEIVWSDAAVEVHRFVVGPLDNNVFVVRCRRTGVGVLVDAANEHERLVPIAQTLGVRHVVETHGHWDHVGAVEHVRDVGIDVWVHPHDAQLLSGYDQLLDDDTTFPIGDISLRVIHTPGHTPGSTSFELINTPVVFTGDTLFPGGPGNTTFDGGDFSSIIHSIETRLCRRYDSNTIIWPGHGAPTTIGREQPHLADWIERGW